MGNDATQEPGNFEKKNSGISGRESLGKGNPGREGDGNAWTPGVRTNNHAGASGQSMLGGAMLLTISLLIVKVIGLLYKLPLSNIFSIDGRGYFNGAYQIYTPIYAIAITGLPIAVARMVAQRVSLGAFRDVRAIKTIAQRLFRFTGLAGTLVMCAVAFPFARYISTGGLATLPAVFAIAPAIFFCCAMSVYRGYYEGLRNMKPTAVSQVIEALCKLVLGLGLAKIVMMFGVREFAQKGTVLGRVVADATRVPHLLYPWSAAAALIGITIGAVFGLLYLWIQNRLHGDGITPEQLRTAPPAAPQKTILREMIRIAIPMVISSSVLNLTNLIDDFNVNYLLRQLYLRNPELIRGLFPLAQTDQYPLYLWGLYGNTLDFRTLIPTIVTALGISALPVIAAAWAQRNHAVVRNKINTVLRLVCLIGFPAGFGMAVLSKQILELFYEKNNPGTSQYSYRILVVFGVATALMAVSAPIISMLQGVGRTDVSVKSLLFGVVVKLGANYLLVSQPTINSFGAAIGTVLFYLTIVPINLVMLLRVTKTRLLWGSTVLKPLFCAGLSTAAAWVVRSGLMRFGAAHLERRWLLFVAVSGAIIAAVVVYVLALLLTKTLMEEDLELFPRGATMKKILKKYHLLGEVS